MPKVKMVELDISLQKLFSNFDIVELIESKMPILAKENRKRKSMDETTVDEEKKKHFEEVVPHRKSDRRSYFVLRRSRDKLIKIHKLRQERYLHQSMIHGLPSGQDKMIEVEMNL